MSTITITRKIKLCPTSDQAELLRSTSLCYTDACNYIARYCVENKTISKKKIQEATYTYVRQSFHLPSQMAISAIRTVTGVLKTIHATQEKWSITPVFKKQRYDLVWNRDYSLHKKTGNFSINTINGREHISTTWKGNEEYEGLEKYGTATLLYKHGSWFLCVPVTIDVEDAELDGIGNVKGVDLGINFLATTYDSHGETEFFSGKHIKHTRGTYKSRRSQLQKRGTSSSRKRLKAIGSRENRWMNDVNHCITKALVSTDTPTLFVMEDLTGIRSATEKVRLKDRYVAVSWSFYDFRQKMEYKAALYGHKIIFVDPAYTSQQCPQCGHTEKKNRNKKLHLFCCVRCGYTSNDDRVAAMNLRNKGIQYRAQCSVSTPDAAGVMSTTP